MNKIIGIRATSGAGKTTLVRQFISVYGGQPLKNSKGKISGYRLASDRTGYGRDTFVLGSYEVVTGGCDGISTQDEICELIKMFSHHGNVLYEGLLVSGLFSRYAGLASELSRSEFVVGYLDTPLDKCVAQTLQRRARKGNTKPFDPQKTLCPKFRSVLSTRHKFESAGFDVRTIPHMDGFAVVDSWFRQPCTSLAEKDFLQSPASRPDTSIGSSWHNPANDMRLENVCQRDSNHAL